MSEIISYLIFLFQTTTIWIPFPISPSLLKYFTCPSAKQSNLYYHTLIMIKKVYVLRNIFKVQKLPGFPPFKIALSTGSTP